MNALSLSATAVAAAAPSRRRPVALPRGAILRLDEARGVTVHAACGRVWITEERRALDVVLRAGEVHRLAGVGRAIASAVRPSRVVLEWASDRPAPRVEIAPAEGEPGVPVTVGGPRFAALLAKLLAWWRTPRALGADGDEDAAPPRSRRGFRLELAPEAVRDRLAAHVPLIRF